MEKQEFLIENAINLVDQHRLSKLQELAREYNRDHDNLPIDEKYFASVDDLIISFWARGEDAGPLGYGEPIDSVLFGYGKWWISLNIDVDELVVDLDQHYMHVFLRHPEKTRDFIIQSLFNTAIGQMDNMFVSEKFFRLVAELADVDLEKFMGRETECDKKYYAPKERYASFIDLVKSLRTIPLSPIAIVTILFASIKRDLIDDYLPLYFSLTGLCPLVA